MGSVPSLPLARGIRHPRCPRDGPSSTRPAAAFLAAESSISGLGAALCLATRKNRSSDDAAPYPSGLPRLVKPRFSPPRLDSPDLFKCVSFVA